ncbi:hypothetical protein SAMN04487934_11819 [Eubacterium ruminantium]|nr:hypothetical protein SAMN04487934_11819 [Eubacterium ruminantium]
MLLFRFNNYLEYSFIEEHKKILENEEYVWVMKVGRLCKQSRLDNITHNGGYIILKAPKNDGNRYYIGKYTEVLNSFPDNEQFMPEYYKSMKENGDLIGLEIQCFKVCCIKELDNEVLNKIVLSVNDRNVSDVISQTRTAVMFVYNTEDLCIEL